MPEENKWGAVRRGDCGQGWGNWLKGRPAAPRNLSAMQSRAWPVFIYAERIFISAPFSLIGQEMAGIVTYLAAQGSRLAKTHRALAAQPRLRGAPSSVPGLSPWPFADLACIKPPSASLSSYSAHPLTLEHTALGKGFIFRLLPVPRFLTPSQPRERSVRCCLQNGQTSGRALEGETRVP